MLSVWWYFLMILTATPSPHILIDSLLRTWIYLCCWSSIRWCYGSAMTASIKLVRQRSEHVVFHVHDESGARFCMYCGLLDETMSEIPRTVVLCHCPHLSNGEVLLMAKGKRDVTPLLTHWSYVSFALSLRPGPRLSSGGRSSGKVVISCGPSKLGPFSRPHCTREGSGHCISVGYPLLLSLPVPRLALSARSHLMSTHVPRLALMGIASTRRPW